MEDRKIKHAFATILFTFFYLRFLSCHFILFVVCDSQPAYQPIDNIGLNCGSSSSTTNNDGETRTWIGDVNSKFFSSEHLQNNVSITAETQFSSTIHAHYKTARLSHSVFSFSFPLSPGQKFVRFYFYSATYLNFDRNKAVFSLKSGLYTLLHNFNASANVHGSDFEIFREFCIYVGENDQKLNITFTPTDRESYAFVNGIEVVSMPTNLYYTPPDPYDQGGRGLSLIGQNNKFLPIENYTSLEMLYRMNIGGRAISPYEDTGMFRTWSNKEDYLLPGYLFDARPANISIKLNYSKVSAYAAPEEVYRTAITMGPNATLNKAFNLTWEYPVDPGFFYMLRLHFCEFEAEINNRNERVFLIYIGDMIAEHHLDVFRQAGGKGIPYFKDYVVFVLTSIGKKVNLSVKLQANPDDYITRYTNVILNGIEIFKLNQSDSNLAGQNPDSPAIQSLPQLFWESIRRSKYSKSQIAMIIIPTVVSGVVAMLALSLFISHKVRTFTDQSSTGGTSKWTLYSMSTNNSSKSRTSNLPSDLCRYFSLVEIRAATRDFDEGFIIGVGGFGNVYKGYVDNGTNQVANKRLKPGSKQGENEFKTEIEMLSQLRHVHLVSLIGYCNENDEMILVYDFMSHGTLRNHLINVGNDEKPLTWEQRLHICIGTARGLQYLHSGTKHTIIHRDVKTTNILLDEKWVAKVSDFGLSKFGPTNMSKTHVSTVVKGSFGYLDPEYCRRQQLTEKSDVYSFGVVLCEVLCARSALVDTKDEIKVLLSELVRRGYRDKTVDQIIDPNIKNEIAPECFKKFIEIVVSCNQSEGDKRPSMNDVVWGLEFALQLQENSKWQDEISSAGNEEGWLLREAMSSNNIELTTSGSQNSSFVYNNGISGVVFSELKDLQGR